MENPTTFNPNIIPPIGGGIPAPVVAPVEEKKIDNKLLDNAPNEVTFGGFFGKVII